MSVFDSSSLFPQPQLTAKLQSMLYKCGKKCDICDNFLVCRNEFTSKVTSKACKVRGNLSCIAKPSCSRSCMVWIAHGTGTALIEKIIVEIKS